MKKARESNYIDSRAVLKREIKSVVVAAALCATPVLYANDELSELSLEQLMNVEVTSASRKTQSLGEVAGAMFVISAEDIRRSGVTSVAEALRMVPGVHVARIDDTRWAVSARGFNDQLSNKMLVMIDGRYIYTPDFGGVFWSDHLPLIDNVERIEVIRGPGAAIWGSNAVNGVINIISRTARDTQGLLLQARGGNVNVSGVTARYGGVTQSGWHYRTDIHKVEENITDSPLDAGNGDFLRQTRTSFRIDSPDLEKSRLSFQGSHYDGNSEEVVELPVFSVDTPFVDVLQNSAKSRGSWLMSNWQYEDSATSSWMISSSIERKSRDFSLGEFAQNSFSFEAQRRLKIGRNHDVVWGLGSRMVDLDFVGRSEMVQELPGYERDYRLYELFLHDEIRLNDRFAITLGAKAQRNSYVDWEYQPNLRLTWLYDEDTTFWASASTASRAPAASERGLRINPAIVLDGFSPTNPSPIPVAISFLGTQDYESESLTALEFGVKGKLGSTFSYDLAAFDFSYKDLLGANLDGVFCQPSGTSVFVDPTCILNDNYLLAQSTFTNNPEGDSRGLELALSWQPTTNWKATGAFTWFDYQLGGANTQTAVIQEDSVVETGVLSEPEKMAYVRSEWTITPEIEFDLVVRAVGESTVYEIDSYVTADLRLEWKPRPGLRVELIGQNLLDDGHTEFGSRILDALPSGVSSSLIGRITWAP